MFAHLDSVVYKMNMLQLLKVLKAMNLNRRPSEVAMGMAIGFWLMLVPGINIPWLLILTALFVVKINSAAAIAVLFLSRPLQGFIDPLLDHVGFLLLTAPPLVPFQQFIAGVPLLVLWQWENTLVTGGVVVGALLLLPLGGTLTLIIILYRRHVYPVLFRSAPVRWFLNLPIVQRVNNWYTRISRVTGW